MRVSALVQVNGNFQPLKWGVAHKANSPRALIYNQKFHEVRERKIPLDQNDEFFLFTKNGDIYEVEVESCNEMDRD